MRRIALILGLLATAAVTVAATAGADDKRTYQAELFNAFGVVEGSELRIAGVKAGSITDLDVTAQKTALITFEVGPGFPDLKADASCSSEPQSLIAEYFLDCQPGLSDQPLEGPIAAARNQTTVQNDLVQNTLREPFKRRFQLLINEFGTALVGNAENLNAAIRSGAPALRELGAVLKILGRQNTIIAQLNADSDVIFEQLAARRDQVVDFIDEAEDTARVSAERRDDLSRDFDLLDDFLFELNPVMVELGNLAREQTPLLIDLRAAAPGLNKLAKNLPGFNEGTRVSLKSLGRASIPGREALGNATEEIAELNRAGSKAQPAADILATFLEDLDDPSRAVEENANTRADLCDPSVPLGAGCAGAPNPGEADRRVQLLEQKRPALPDLEHPGYTGLEGLLNYGYIQPLSLNIFNDIGHALHLNLVGASGASEGGGECGHTSEGPDYPAKGGDGTARTNDVAQAPYCAALLGDYQPGITAGTVPSPGGTTFGLPPYHPSVCPEPDPPSGVGGGSTNHAICDPTGPATAGFQTTAAPAPGGGEAPSQPGAREDLTPKELEKLRESLGLPPKAPIPNLPTLPTLPTVPTLPNLGGPAPGSSPNTIPGGDLLDFLLGP
jgi:ABC-type transporter Mla subunit MlaD